MLHETNWKSATQGPTSSCTEEDKVENLYIAAVGLERAQMP